MSTNHEIIDVVFDEKGVSFLSLTAAPPKKALVGGRLEKNHYYLGQLDSVTYSLRFKSGPVDHSQSQLDPKFIKLMGENFFLQKVVCAVIGCRGTSDRFTHRVQNESFEAGKLIASYGFVTLTGGLSGVMEKAAEGAKALGGRTLGILPGSEKNLANPFIDIVVPSGIGIARNYIIAQTADILIAVNGGRGTLEEICYGLDFDKTILSLDSWVIPGVIEIKHINEVEKYLIEYFYKTLLLNLTQRYEPGGAE